MFPAANFKNQHIGVFGLGLSGVAAARALKASGALVHCWDDNPDNVEQYREELHITDLYNMDFNTLDGIIFPPGMPLIFPRPHPLVGKAITFHVPIMGDLELFSQIRPELPAHKLVTVTGTNGKSTTASLLAHVLSEAGVPTALGGNIGVPVMDLDPLPEGGVYVLEVSSFQIDLTERLQSDIAMILNFAPDHLDRHGDMAGYVEAKTRLIEMLGDEGQAYLSLDDEWSLNAYQSFTGRKTGLSSQTEVSNGLYIQSGTLWENRDVYGHDPVFSLRTLENLPGLHNWQNVMYVYAAARDLGLSKEQILAGLKSFKGLAHRMEQVTCIGDVLFVNDSKATNSHAALKALSAFDKVQWIAGGLYKEQSFGPFLAGLKKIKKLWLIGTAADDMAAFFKGQVELENVGTLEKAVEGAYQAAKAEGCTVLLSPACASFDQFKSFGDRGDQFKQLVHALAEQEQG